MKKKLTALFLCFVMVFTMLPVTVFADPDEGPQDSVITVSDDGQGDEQIPQEDEQIPQEDEQIPQEDEQSPQQEDEQSPQQEDEQSPEPGDEEEGDPVVSDPQPEDADQPDRVPGDPNPNACLMFQMANYWYDDGGLHFENRDDGHGNNEIVGSDRDRPLELCIRDEIAGCFLYYPDGPDGECQAVKYQNVSDVQRIAPEAGQGDNYFHDKGRGTNSGFEDYVLLGASYCGTFVFSYEGCEFVVKVVPAGLDFFRVPAFAQLDAMYLWWYDGTQENTKLYLAADQDVTLTKAPENCSASDVTISKWVDGESVTHDDIYEITINELKSQDIEVYCEATYLDENSRQQSFAGTIDIPVVDVRDGLVWCQTYWDGDGFKLNGSRERYCVMPRNEEWVGRFYRATWTDENGWTAAGDPIPVSQLTYDHDKLEITEENGFVHVAPKALGCFSVANSGAASEAAAYFSVAMPEFGFYTDPAGGEENLCGLSWDYTGANTPIYLVGPDSFKFSASSAVWSENGNKLHSVTSQDRRSVAIRVVELNDDYLDVHFSGEYDDGRLEGDRGVPGLRIRNMAPGLRMRWMYWDEEENKFVASEDQALETGVFFSPGDESTVSFVDYDPNGDPVEILVNEADQLKDYDPKIITVENVENTPNGVVRLKAVGFGETDIKYYPEPDNKPNHYISFHVEVGLPEIGAYKAADATQENFVGVWDFTGANTPIYVMPLNDDIRLTEVEGYEYNEGALHFTYIHQDGDDSKPVQYVTVHLTQPMHSDLWLRVSFERRDGDGWRDDWYWYSVRINDQRTGLFFRDFRWDDNGSRSSDENGILYAELWDTPREATYEVLYRANAADPWTVVPWNELTVNGDNVTVNDDTWNNVVGVHMDFKSLGDVEFVYEKGNNASVKVHIVRPEVGLYTSGEYGSEQTMCDNLIGSSWYYDGENKDIYLLFHDAQWHPDWKFGNVEFENDRCKFTAETILNGRGVKLHLDELEGNGSRLRFTVNIDEGGESDHDEWFDVRIKSYESGFVYVEDWDDAYRNEDRIYVEIGDVLRLGVTDKDHPDYVVAWLDDDLDDSIVVSGLEFFDGLIGAKLDFTNAKPGEYSMTFCFIKDQPGYVEWIDANDHSKGCNISDEGFDNRTDEIKVYIQVNEPWTPESGFVYVEGWGDALKDQDTLDVFKSNVLRLGITDKDHPDDVVAWIADGLAGSGIVVSGPEFFDGLIGAKLDFTNAKPGEYSMTFCFVKDQPDYVQWKDANDSSKGCIITDAGFANSTDKITVRFNVMEPVAVMVVKDDVVTYTAGETICVPKGKNVTLAGVSNLDLIGDFVVAGWSPALDQWQKDGDGNGLVDENNYMPTTDGKFRVQAFEGMTDANNFTGLANFGFRGPMVDTSNADVGDEFTLRWTFVRGSTSPVANPSNTWDKAEVVVELPVKIRVVANTDTHLTAAGQTGTLGDDGFYHVNVDANSSNKTVELKVEASADTELTYQWRRGLWGGMDVGHYNVPVEGADKATYTVEADESQEYICVVSDANGNSKTVCFRVNVCHFVTSQAELIAALNAENEVSEIHVTKSFTVTKPCVILHDDAHLDNYFGTCLYIDQGVTLTVGDGGVIGDHVFSYDGDKYGWNNAPMSCIVNNGTIVFEKGSSVESCFQVNNGTITVKDGGECLVVSQNYGTVTVESGGAYRTTQGDDAVNNGTVTVAQGAEMEARFGSTIINKGTMTLNGQLWVSCIRHPDGDGIKRDHVWFRNEGGTMLGSGEIFLTDIGGGREPIEDMASLANGVKSQIAGNNTIRVTVYDGIFNVTSEDQLTAALNYNHFVKEIHITQGFTLTKPCLMLHDDAHLDSYFDTRLYIDQGVTLTVGEGGILGNNFHSYEGDVHGWENAPTAQLINNGTVIVASGGETDDFFDVNNGTITVQSGGKATVVDHNYGTVNVESGAEYRTTMAGTATNEATGTVTVAKGAEMEARMGTTIINKGTITLNGTLIANCIRHADDDGVLRDHVWFRSSGTVLGEGEILLTDIGRENNPMADMAAAVDGVKNQIAGNNTVAVTAFIDRGTGWLLDYKGCLTVENAAAMADFQTNATAADKARVKAVRLLDKNMTPADVNLAGCTNVKDVYIPAYQSNETWTGFTVAGAELHFWKDLTATVVLPKSIQQEEKNVEVKLLDESGKKVEVEADVNTVTTGTNTKKENVAINGVADGEYKMEVAQEGCVTRKISVEVKSGELEVKADVTLVVKGNLNGAGSSDGDTNIEDMACLFDFLAKGLRTGELVPDTVTDEQQKADNEAYFDAVADVNGNNCVDILDYQAMYEMVKPASAG